LAFADQKRAEENILGVVRQVQDNRIHFPLRGPADCAVAHVVETQPALLAINAHA